MDVGDRSDFLDVFRVLKRAELVEDVDAEVVDEGIIIIGAVQGHPVTDEAIGLGIFVVVEQSACIPTLYQIGNSMFDIVHDNVHDIDEKSTIRYRLVRYRHSILCKFTVSSRKDAASSPSNARISLWHWSFP